MRKLIKINEKKKNTKNDVMILIEKYIVYVCSMLDHSILEKYDCGTLIKSSKLSDCVRIQNKFQQTRGIYLMLV